MAIALVVSIVLSIVLLAILSKTRDKLNQQIKINRFLLSSSQSAEPNKVEIALEPCEDSSIREQTNHEDIIPSEFRIALDSANSSEIVFKNISHRKLRHMGKSIQPISLSNPLTALPAIGVNAAVVANAPALFTSTVAPTTLTKFADGTFSTMVHGTKGILKNAGFSQLNPTAVFAPILIFQAASILTGQYYMHGITKQLQSIEKKIDHLIDLHHIEKASILRGHHNVLSAIADKANLAEEDLNELRTIARDATSIREHYLALLRDLDYDSYKNIRQRMTSARTVDDIRRKVSEDRLDVYGQMIRTAERIILISKSLEFKCILHLAQTDARRIRFAIEKAEELNYLSQQLIDDKWDENLINIFSSALKAAKEAKSTAIRDSSSEKATDLINILRDMNNTCKNERVCIQQDAHMVSSNISDCLNKPREILMYLTPEGEVEYAELK